MDVYLDKNNGRLYYKSGIFIITNRKNEKNRNEYCLVMLLYQGIDEYYIPEGKFYKLHNQLKKVV